MASADHPPAPVPEAATGIQPAAVPLPALPPVAHAPGSPKSPASPERYARRCLVLDGMLVALVLVFAFLVASFAVHNGDFFRQLATGRFLAEGKATWGIDCWLGRRPAQLPAGDQYAFGSDPFTWGSGDAYWVNHSWLFGLLVYGVYRIPDVGEAAVVVLKALLVTALAAVLLGVGRRRGRPLWVPAACTGLAVLALSPRLTLGPSCFSYLFLGLTLWLLRHPRQVRARQAASAGHRSFWLLPLLFLLWVNLDAYFLLGPILVAFYLVGEALRTRLVANAAGPDQPGPGELRTLSIALVVAVAACLVNPFGAYAFALPEGLGLSPGAAALRDSQAGGYFLSPLGTTYLQPRYGLSVAGMAYFPLLLLGAASFVLLAVRHGPPTLIGWRLFVWLPLAVLSLASYRCIGFFAVVAGPVTALNLLDGVGADAAGLSPAGRRWALGGRAATLLLVLAAVLATVPGWLQVLPHSRWRVAWAVHPDRSLRLAAEQVRTWREKDLVPPGTRWFNLSPDFANYLAWFAPGERALFDQRFSLFGAVGPDFKIASQELGKDDPGPPEDQSEAEERAPWRRVFRERGVRFIVVPTTERSLVTAHRLLSNPAEWVPCYLDGSTAIFGWREPPASSPGNPLVQKPKEPDPFAAVRLNFRRRAFGPEAERAPLTPGRAPEVQPWWTEWWTPPQEDLDGNAVLTHSTRFEALGPALSQRHRLAWEAGQAAGLIGCAAGAGGPVGNGMLLPLRTNFTYRILHGLPTTWQKMDERVMMVYQMNLERQDSGPPESLYLAVRAARRSLAVNPDEPRTHLWLGRAYGALWWRTKEHALGSDLPLADIRRTQASAALNCALKLGASNDLAREAHVRLAALYLEANPQKRPYLDLAARHLRQQVRIARETGSLPGIPAKLFQQEVDRLEQEVEKRERDVNERRDRFENNAINKPLWEKVRIALELGLAEMVLKLVGETDREELIKRPDVVAEYLNLLLDTGELEEVRRALDPGEKPADRRSLGANLWFQVRLAAADGDYAAADRYLAEAQAAIAGAANPRVPLAVAQMLAAALQREATQVGGALWLPPALRWPAAVNEAIPLSIIYYLRPLQAQAELHLVRGWLALEAGSIELAGEHLNAAAKLALPPEEQGTRLRELAELNARGNATRAIADRCRLWLNAK